MALRDANVRIFYFFDCERLDQFNKLTKIKFMRNPILDLIMLVMVLISIFGSIFVARKAKSKLQSGQILQDPLADDEKNKVFLLTLLNPIWGGLIFYLEWKYKLPVKASQANKISFISFGIWLLLSWIFGWPINFSV